MKIIVDANILFALLIKESKTHEIIFSKHLEIFTTDFILEEIENHKDEILEKTKRSTVEYHSIFNDLKNIINIISIRDTMEYVEEAQKISPDPKDVHYFALAMKLNIPLWSNDKQLKEQDSVKVYSTDEIVKKLKK